MKIHRFFIKENFKNLLKGDELTITNPALIHQMKDVLRLRKGDLVTILNGSDTSLQGEVKILIKKESIISKIKMKKESNFSKIKMNLFSSLIKKDKYEWVLQKCTEIGVSHFYPVISERTEKVNINSERAEKIIIEAVEQSERSDCPELSQPISLDDALKVCETNKAETFVLHTDSETSTISVSQIKSELVSGKIGDEINIFIGPEGGFGEKDIETFKRHDVQFIKVGQNVLRAETANVAIASLLLL